MGEKIVSVTTAILVSTREESWFFFVACSHGSVHHTTVYHSLSLKYNHKLQTYFTSYIKFSSKKHLVLFDFFL